MRGALPGSGSAKLGVDVDTGFLEKPGRQNTTGVNDDRFILYLDSFATLVEQYLLCRNTGYGRR
jgi:hypothetical protein